MNSIKVLLFLAMIVLVASVAESHKHRYNQAPIYGPQRDECICDCGLQQGPLPSQPFYGSGGYRQPRPSGGYANAGAGAVAYSGAFGSGSGQTSGGY